MTCKLCGENNKLVKAHAIPEAFFLEAALHDTPFLIPRDQNVFPKRSRIGVYDNAILCEKCEPNFSSLDDYGNKVLSAKYNDYFSELPGASGPSGFLSTTVEKEKLHRFFLSVLWRSAVSRQKFYATVNLGQHEDAVKNLMFNYEMKKAETYGVALARWKSNGEYEPLTRVMLNPVLIKANGINVYTFYFGKTLAYIKVDRRPFPHPYNSFEIFRNDELFVVARDIHKSKELRQMQVIANHHKALK